MMAYNIKVIQRCFSHLEFRVPWKSGYFQPESVSTLLRNQCLFWIRIGVYFTPEYAFKRLGTILGPFGCKKSQNSLNQFKAW